MSGEEPSCDNCKYDLTKSSRYPCSECGDYTMDKWVWEGEIE